MTIKPFIIAAALAASSVAAFAEGGNSSGFRDPELVRSIYATAAQQQQGRLFEGRNAAITHSPATERGHAVPARESRFGQDR